MQTISRRTIASGTAWAVPVIFVGAIVPMASASPLTQVEATGAGCKQPGRSQNVDWGYEIELKVTATTDTVVSFTNVTTPGDPNPVFIGDTSFPVSAGTSTIRVVIGASNSANGTAVLTYVANGIAGAVAASISGFNPCKK